MLNARSCTTKETGVLCQLPPFAYLQIRLKTQPFKQIFSCGLKKASGLGLSMEEVFSKRAMALLSKMNQSKAFSEGLEAYNVGLNLGLCPLPSQNAYCANFDVRAWGIPEITVNASWYSGIEQSTEHRRSPPNRTQATSSHYIYESHEISTSWTSFLNTAI